MILTPIVTTISTAAGATTAVQLPTGQVCRKSKSWTADGKAFRVSDTADNTVSAVTLADQYFELDVPAHKNEVLFYASVSSSLNNTTLYTLPMI